MISSRTPEGPPNRCTICGHQFKLAPSIDTRDAPCPVCGSLAWFAQPPPATDEAWANAVLNIGAERLGRPSLAVSDAIYAIHDTERLEALTIRVMEVGRWEELFGG